jgi:hypothetical protein
VSKLSLQLNFSDLVAFMAILQINYKSKNFASDNQILQFLLLQALFKNHT